LLSRAKRDPRQQIWPASCVNLKLFYSKGTSYNEYTLVIGCKVGYAPVASSVDANSGSLKSFTGFHKIHGHSSYQHSAVHDSRTVQLFIYR
jgi:hypothetical protein